MALYNNGYPATYQQYYPQYQPVSPVSPQNNAQAQQNGIIWVSGEAGAKAYLVAPNNTVQLWDSENQTIYLKSADASGMPSMKVLDYTIREMNKNPSKNVSSLADDNLPIYATKDEIKAVFEQIKVLRAKVDKLSKQNKEENDE